MNASNQVLGYMWSIFFTLITVSMPMMAVSPAKKAKKSCSSSSSDHKKKFDYVIVGCGSAGSILARKLSDGNKKSVCVLEFGINRNDDPIILASYSDPNIVDDFWIIQNDPQYSETYDVRVFSPLQTTIYTEGHAWGGSASHNFQTVARGTPEIYDSWAAISGNPQWSYNNMLPLMKALENYNPCGSFDPSQRGFSGPISMTQNPPVLTDPLSNALVSATTVGFINDYNDPTDISTTGHLNLGYSAAQVFATLGNSSCVPGVERAGTRSFSANEFLDTSVVTIDGKGVRGRKLEIRSNSWANRVIFKGNKAVGVEYVTTTSDGATHSEVVYGKEIILCAGAINSPAILERSGIGDPSVLTPLGIEVLVPNTNVGNNLVSQYGYQAVVAVGTTDLFNQGWWNLHQNPSKPAFDPVYSYPDDNTRRVQVNMLPGGPSVSLVVPFVLEPSSIGSTHIVSINPFIQPLLDLNMYSDGSYLTPGTDANQILTSLNLIASGVGVNNMLLPPPGAFLQNPPGVNAALDSDLFDYVKSPDALTVADHVVATTRMGTSAANGVVDGNLNVFGVKHLKIADIGVLPVLPNGNTCYSAYMVGLRAATILGVDVPPAL